MQAMSGKFASLVVTFLFLVAASGEQCPDPDQSTVLSGCDPDSRFESNLDLCLPKKQRIFGVVVRGAPDVPFWAWTYASNVLARYLDSNQDGQADDGNLIAALAPTQRQLGFAILRCYGSIGKGRLKDSWFAIAHTNGQESLSEHTRFQRQVIEEFHHGVFYGLEKAYPTVFGSSTSELRAAIDESYGNCQRSYVCAMAVDCKHYTCTCTNDPQPCDDAGQYDCIFETGSCNGVFHYEEPSCSGGCLVTEGFYRAWTTAYGYECAGQAAEMAAEWGICTAAELESNPKTAKLYAIVTGTAASQQTLGYVLPSVVPDGSYSYSLATATGGDTTTQASSGYKHSGYVSSSFALMRLVPFMMIAARLLTYLL